VRRFVLVLLAISIVALPLVIFRGQERAPARPRVALIEITGTIDETSASSPWSEPALGARDVIGYLRTVQDDPRYAAVVVRIDSPGGSPAAAQEIYQAILRTRAAGKPVVASMGDMATSAAYYVAAAADRIVANPGTLTGSIGAIMEVLVVEDLLARLGINPETIVSGPYKDTGSPYRELEPWERDYLQQLVNDLLDQFVQDVAHGRRMDAQAVRELADGRVFSGRQALALGLVDQLGGLEDAVEAASELAGLAGRPAVVPFRRERSLYDRLLGMTSTLIARWWLQPAALEALGLGSRSGAPAQLLDNVSIPPWGYRLR